MYNIKFRSYVRNRPKFYRLARRAGRNSHTRVLGKMPSKASRYGMSGAVVVHRPVSSGQVSRAVVNYVPRSGYLVKRSRDDLIPAGKRTFTDYAENYFRSHPKLVKMITSNADFVWDNGLRDVVRGHLKARKRGRKKGRFEL